MRVIRNIAGFIPALIWMGVIYWFSSLIADISSLQSGDITMELVRVYVGIVNTPEARQVQIILGLEPYIRKFAHMTEYAILSLLLLRAFKGVQTSYRRSVAFSIAICAIYACTDEWHQTFIYGRSGSIKDVLIDISGALIAIMIHAVVTHNRHKMMH